jgi:hypothetical protein
VDDVIFENSPPPACPFQLMQNNLILLSQQFYSRRCEYSIVLLQSMAFRLLPKDRSTCMLHLRVIIAVLMLRLSPIGLHFEEDIANHASLILQVVQFLDDSLLGGCDFSELLIRLNICDLLELLDMLSLLYVQLLHLPLLDLLTQVRKGETQKRQPESKPLTSVKRTPYSPRNYHYKSVYNVEDLPYPHNPSPPKQLSQG